ncbi:hypothetical protein [Sphingomonas baiyangensis]|uniref:Uncharacterized protein n=1 Tax=Sphingomonas baiyangensis TaxID=2572576 RepID=A0A4U1L650_9SPHN|nr:hypothetical protein [Sphingomonas baiyangensis]TKD51793.1 hypothetical protein FBR43_14305 [Sphingomonas baiyangensis]
MRALAALCCVLASGCAASPQQQALSAERAERALAAVTEGRVAGPAETCIPATNINGPQIVAPDKLIYRENARRVWISTAIGCPSLNANSIVVARVFGAQICRNDLFQTLPRGGGSIPSAACRFGDFVPWERPG